MTECKKCHREITPEGRDGNWTDDPHDQMFGDICTDGNYHEPDEAP
jgi:hypothetical protein